MKVEDKHLYHGAAVMQIAEDKQFTAINPLLLNGYASNTGLLINTNIVVFPKYASKPKGGKVKGYQFTFTKENLEEIRAAIEPHKNMFIVLVCVHDREICCLTSDQFYDLYQRRRKDVGYDEEQFVLLVNLPKGKKFRVYVAASGVRRQYLGKLMLIARSDFPGVLFR